MGMLKYFSKPHWLEVLHHISLRDFSVILYQCTKLESLELLVEWFAKMYHTSVNIRSFSWPTRVVDYYVNVECRTLMFGIQTLTLSLHTSKHRAQHSREWG